MEKSSVKIASFKEAIVKFLSLIDSNDEGVIKIFQKLKEEKQVSHTNETNYWHGNHSQETKTFTLYRVEEPLVFYILETITAGNSSHSYRYVEREIFIPKES